ncbi:hypothetical protein Acsp04_19500 [Actinomadura sp. NBRC 104425]|nr:hypothetical protein Acsp04_19500 [Actinomadura sp. NBRC 104425]
MQGSGPSSTPRTEHRSRLATSLQGVSLRRSRTELPDLARHRHPANKPWSGFCFTGSVGGAPIGILRQHIERRNPSVRAR